MSWEDDDFDATTVAKAAVEPSKTPASWEDEEEDATWEDIAAEEARKLAEAAAAVPKNPHAGKPLKKKKEKKVAFAEEQRQLTAEEEAEELRRREELVKAADFENALDLFGATEVVPKKAASTQETLDSFVPRTDAEFQKFARMLGDKIAPLATTKTNKDYREMVKEALKFITDPMSVDDVKDVIKILNVVVNDKIKAAKPTKGKSTKKTPATKLNLRGGASGGQFEDHVEGEYDDYADDFM